MRKPKRSAEELCIEYAIAQAWVRDETRMITWSFCTIPRHRNYNKNCLDVLFAAPKGPDGECPRFAEFYDPMCVNCKKRLEAIEARVLARRRLGGIKRSIGALGRRLAAEVEA